MVSDDEVEHAYPEAMRDEASWDMARQSRLDYSERKCAVFIHAPTSKLNMEFELCGFMLSDAQLLCKRLFISFHNFLCAQAERMHYVCCLIYKIATDKDLLCWRMRTSQIQFLTYYYF